jgi:exonuclease V gamma subunit
VTYGRLNGARLLAAWIRHLFLTVCAPEVYPGTTHLIGRDPEGKDPLKTCSFPPLGSHARNDLSHLVKSAVQGTDNLFYFFCETSWQFVQALSKENFDLSRESVFTAMNQAKTRSSWYGNFHVTGEIHNPYIRLCVENNDPFENVDALISSGFIKNSLMVYQPLLKNMSLS